jgi:glucosamine--fructose-6-phosphate aminotransferase (isomerizing)
MKTAHEPGAFMRAEIAEAPDVFARAVTADHRRALADIGFGNARAIYTIARGSSDAAANILSYEWMRALQKPMTSLPPSIFSLGDGVSMSDAAALVISQSGASEDLVRSARGIRDHGGIVAAITNVEGSRVEAASQAVLRIGAGTENAVPATKTVIGSIAAGMAGLAALAPDYGACCADAADAMKRVTGTKLTNAKIVEDLVRFQSVYVVGRGAGYGAAHEVALKIKETCARHAEAYSASEVMHGPLQLVKAPLMVLLLDSREQSSQDSLNAAETRFRADGSAVHRIGLPFDTDNLTAAAVAAMLLYLIYPVILETALSLGFDPDAPETLKKVTATV